MSEGYSKRREIRGKEQEEREGQKEREKMGGFGGNEISPEGGFKIRAQPLHNVSDSGAVIRSPSRAPG